MEEPQLSQDSLSSLIGPPEIEQPVTPEPAHAPLPNSATTALSALQANRVDNATNHMTPPPSTQIPSSQRAKTRTPTPTVSHISTPPPTVELPTQSQPNRFASGFSGAMSSDEIASASPEELRAKVTELQAAVQEAKMTAAHHKLQYQMLSQESAAAIERMAVEARMAQYENEVIHVAEQARAAATPVQPSPLPEGTIPVQKELYQRMCSEIQQLTEHCNYHAHEQIQQEKTILRQDLEIASLSDKVMMMSDRIRKNREQMNRYRKNYSSQRADSTPRSMYSDPLRSGVSSQEQPQPFAALLQASEMASQEAQRPVGHKKGHNRNTHSMSSLPNTPSHSQKHSTFYHTPQSRQSHIKVPSTAPLPRTSAMRTPDVYSQRALPVSHVNGPLSDGTVSAPEDDSEAETEILEQDEISESHASRVASQMLKSSQEQQAKRNSFKGDGMLQQGGGEKFKQTKLFGQVRKANVERGNERPAKRARTGQAVGLGIAGVRD